MSRLESETVRSQKNGSVFGLLIIRLTRLREINHEYGYGFADSVLTTLYKIIKNNLRQKDYIAKIGDKDYGVILSDTRGEGDSILIANQIINNCSEPVKINNISFRIRVHVGIANYPVNANEVTGLLKCADLATLKAGKNSDNYFIFETTDDDNTTTMLSMEGELEDAISDGQIDNHYQPKVDMASGHITGFEILSRWHNKKWGNVRPDLFIAAAEQANLITDLTVNSLTKTLKDFSQLQDKYKETSFTLSVNLSAKILNNQENIERIIDTINIWCEKPETLILEITESAIMTDPDSSRDTLNLLHASGIKISMDDFGTGYSSLSYLKKLPVDELKIDKSFVSGLIDSEDDTKIVQSIIDLARNFNLSITAEGIESKEVIIKLRNMGCNVGQGYYISKPMAFDQLPPWIDNWDSNYIL